MEHQLRVFQSNMELMFHEEIHNRSEPVSQNEMIRDVDTAVDNMSNEVTRRIVRTLQQYSTSLRESLETHIDNEITKLKFNQQPTASTHPGAPDPDATPSSESSSSSSSSSSNSSSNNKRKKKRRSAKKLDKRANILKKRAKLTKKLTRHAHMMKLAVLKLPSEPIQRRIKFGEFINRLNHILQNFPKTANPLSTYPTIHRPSDTHVNHAV